MSNELQCVAPSGSALYAVLWAEAGTVYSSTLPGLEAYTAGHFPAQYPITLTEQGASGHYLASMPGSLAAGLYLPEVRLQAGGAPAASDPVIGAGSLDWNGTAEVTHGLALGTDGRVLVSANSHTAGETVAAVTGNVGGSTASVVGAVGSVSGNVSGSVASVVAGVTVSGTVALSAGDETRLLNLDAAVSSRLATAGYTAPSNASIATILTNVAAILANTDVATSSRLATSGYTAPDNTDTIAALADLVTLLARTDPTSSLTTLLTNVATLLTRADVATSTRAAIADYTSVRAAKLDNLDAAISTRLAATADPTTALTAVKAKTDQLSFTGGNVNADALAASNVTVAGYASGMDPATLVLAVPANKLTTDGAGAISLKAADETLLAGAMTAAGYTAPPSAATVAAAILVTPAQKLVTDAAGHVALAAADEALLGHLATMVNGTPAFTAPALALAPTGGTAPTTAAIAAAILVNPSHLLATDAAGAISLTSADEALLAAAMPASSYVAPANASIASALADLVTLIARTDPTANIATILGDVGTILGRVDVAVSSRQPSGAVTVGGYSTGEDPASLLLLTPAHKLASDAAGAVSLPASAPSGYGSSGGTVVSGYSAGQDPASLLLLHPGNLLNTDSSGNVSTAGGSDSASIADILATTSQMSFTSGNINAWAANSVPVPANAVVVISTTSVNVVAGDMPNILNLQLSRDATFVLTTTALDAAGNLVDLTGGSAVVMVKRNAGDLDADALLVADSGDVGGIAIADPSTGVLVLTLAADALSNATTFPDSRPLVWGMKLFLAGGIVRDLIVGTFTVFDFPVASVTPPA